MSLNAHSPVPLYRQLALHLRERIDRGEIATREKIPSEHALAREFGVGRPTVRQATDLLVREGILQRRRGAGTFVLPPARRIDLFSLAGTSAALRELRLPVRIELTAPLARVAAPAPLAGSEAFELQRVTRIDGEPLLFERLYLDAGLFAGIERLALDNQSLARLARDHFHVEPTSAEQSFDIAAADEDTAALLEVVPDSPLLKVYRELHFGAGRCAICGEILCRTDRYRFSQSLSTPEPLN